VLQYNVALASLADATQSQTAVAAALAADISSASPDVTGSLAEHSGTAVTAVPQTTGTHINLYA
jgi:hypothetical protein